MRSYREKGFVVVVLFFLYGLWLLWRGIRNDVPVSVAFGEPLISRWVFVGVGIMVMLASAGYVCGLLYLIR